MINYSKTVNISKTDQIFCYLVVNDDELTKNTLKSTVYFIIMCEVFAFMITEIKK